MYYVGWIALIGSFVLNLSAARADKVFRDDFNSPALDQSVWYISDGWANSKYQNCSWSRKMVSVVDGNLVLRLTDDKQRDRDFSCAEVQTKRIFGYGTFEMRMRANQDSGATATFFTYIGQVHKKPHMEIDFEVLGRKPSEVQVNYFVEGKGGNERHVQTGDSAAFQIYSFVWSPDRIVWYVDGVKKHETTGGRMPDIPQKIYLSLWASDNLEAWLGPFRYRGKPLVYEIDWVAHTPAGESCGFPELVLCKVQ